MWERRFKRLWDNFCAAPICTAANSAYQNPGMAFDLGIRQNLVKQLKEAVEGMGKKVTVTYY